MGILVIAITLGLTYGAQYISDTVGTGDFDESGEELPPGTSVEVSYDTVTYESEEQRFSVDYPKEYKVAELPKKYYQKTKRFFEGQTIFASDKRTNDPNYFRMTINFQRNYQDTTDRNEMLSNMLSVNRFCKKGNLKTLKEGREIINDITYVVRTDAKGCDAQYTTYYDTITWPGTYVIEIRTNQPYAKVRAYSDRVLKNLALDYTP